jgi:hypothetical protein
MSFIHFFLGFVVLFFLNKSNALDQSLSDAMSDLKINKPSSHEVFLNKELLEKAMFDEEKSHEYHFWFDVEESNICHYFPNVPIIHPYSDFIPPMVYLAWKLDKLLMKTSKKSFVEHILTSSLFLDSFKDNLKKISNLEDTETSFLLMAQTIPERNKPQQARFHYLAHPTNISHSYSCNISISAQLIPFLNSTEQLELKLDGRLESVLQTYVHPGPPLGLVCSPSNGVIFGTDFQERQCFASIAKLPNKKITVTFHVFLSEDLLMIKSLIIEKKIPKNINSFIASMDTFLEESKEDENRSQDWFFLKKVLNALLAPTVISI